MNLFLSKNEPICSRVELPCPLLANMQSLTATHGDLMMISKKGKSLLGLLFLYFPPFENVYNPRHTQSYSIAGLMPYEHTMNRDSQCCSTCRKKMCRAILLSKSGNA